MLPEFCRGHFELGLDTEVGEIVELGVELLEQISVGVESSKITELDFESSEE